MRTGDDLIFARTVTGRGAGTRLSDVRVYDRTGGTLERLIEAKRAATADGAWRLEEVETFDVAGRPSSASPSLLIARRRASPTSSPSPRSDAGRAGFRRPCAPRSQDLQAAGRPTGPLEASLWHKISGPLSAVLMPLLAAVAAFGLARAGQLFLRAVIRDGARLRLFRGRQFRSGDGQFRRLPAFARRLGAVPAFLLIGETVLIRTEE